MKKNSVIITALTLITIVITFSACKAKKLATNECATFLVTYNTDVKPLIDVNCANTCHSAANQAGGIDLSTYEKVKAISAQSNFLGAVRHLAGFTPMPKKAPKLSDSAIKVLSCWVSNGSPQ